MTKIWISLLIFLVGVGLGLGAPSVAPKYLGPYFPKSLMNSRVGVQGSVVKKQLEDDRLLLTISAPDGALLATFQKKITEISLLIDEGDSVTLDVRVYDPFVADPPILRVKKPDVLSSPTKQVPLLPESIPENPTPPSSTESVLEEPDSPTHEPQQPILVPDMELGPDQQL
ncbi:MAG: hypothetical protein ACPGYT_13025 [Nitrospirales bacterium]